MSESRDRNSVQSVEKALGLLVALGRARQPLAVAELAAQAGLSSTAVYRLLRALEKGGAVSRSPATGKYGLGFLAHELAGRADPHGHIRLAAAGPMLMVQDQCGGETVGLYVPVNSSEFMCIETLPGKHEIRYMEVLYRPIVVGRGATSRVFLAAMLERYGHSAVLSYLSGLPDHLRALPAVDLVELARETLDRGYAHSDSTRIPGLTSLAAPVHGRLGGILGAITLSWPTGRVDGAVLPEWGEHLRACAAAVTRRVTDVPPAP
ncbi:IclR family transcriptional regulator [Streptomyces sp. NPDC055955]|uniref:IclR family transcriptional regulator n=1 Tax=Streptomyces sp. NPDC055955 TaxID=3345665 RepID=UPI0035DF77D0